MTLIRLSSLSDMVTSIPMSPWPEDWILYARKSDITKWVKSDIRIWDLQDCQSSVEMSIRWLVRNVLMLKSLLSAKSRHWTLYCEFA